MIYKTIEELTTVVTGGTPSTLKAEYWENGNIPWLQSGCCQNCDVNQADKFISQSGYDNSSTQVMPMNTVMIALTGATAGKVGYLNIEACGNQSITGIFPCEELNPRFLFYFLISQRRKILVDCVGGAQAHISQGYVKKIKVPVYSKNIQERIVNIMNICSKNIKHYEMILKEYDELVKARFIEMFGDPVADTKNWGQTLLKEHLESIKYGTSTPPIFTDDGYAFIRATNIKNGKIVTNDMKYIPQEEADRLEKCKLSGGEIIIVRSGVNAGDTCVVTDEYIGQYAGYDMILVLSSDLHPVFFNTLINTEYMDKVVKPLTRRAAQPHLNSEQTQRLPIIEVPFELQEQFADFVKQVDKSRFDIKKSIIELEREVVYD